MIDGTLGLLMAFPSSDAASYLLITENEHPLQEGEKTLLHDLSHQIDDRVPSLFLFKYPK